MKLAGEELHVHATLPAAERFVIEDAAFEFLADYRARCFEGRCELHYRFRLFEAAREIDDAMTARLHRGVVLAPVSTWLMRPDELRAFAGQRYRVELDARADSYVFALERARDGAPHTYEAEVLTLPRGPFAAFGGPGAVRTSSRTIGGGALEIALLPGEFAGGEARVIEWVEEAARDVTAFYGRFPLPRAVVVVLPMSGTRSGYGMALGNGGASIVIGAAEEARSFAGDWQMTHELFHLGFPNLLRKHHWLEEGVATYLEPIARARRGRLSKARAIAELRAGLEKGLPRAGDRGLDLTRTWGRTYWGGALFCFLADLRIRKLTENRRSFDDVARAILEAGGDLRDTWSIGQVIEIGDRATGTTVLAELYAAHGQSSVTVDLEAIFAEEREVIDAIFSGGASHH